MYGLIEQPWTASQNAIPLMRAMAGMPTQIRAIISGWRCCPLPPFSTTVPIAASPADQQLAAQRKKFASWAAEQPGELSRRRLI